jgi:hypothetical protein
MAMADHSEHEADWLSGVRAAFAAAASGANPSKRTSRICASADGRSGCVSSVPSSPDS